MDQRAEFDRLLQPILGVAYGTALKLTGSPEDAVDLIQDAGVLAYRAYHQYEVGTNFKAWFFRIFTNRLYKDRQKAARQTPTISIDDAEDLFLYKQFQKPGIQTLGDDPVGDLFNKLDSEAVEAVLDKLQEDYRTVAVQYFMNGFTYEQIAEVLEVPIGTVRSRLHRARKLLQRALWQVACDRRIVQEEGTTLSELRPFGCAEAFRRLDDYLDRELSAEEMRLVKEHLELCQMCAKEFLFEDEILQQVSAKLSKIDLPLICCREWRRRSTKRKTSSRRLGRRRTQNRRTCGPSQWRDLTP